MSATVLIPFGSGIDSSSDIEIVAGDPATIFIDRGDENASVNIAIKNPNGTYKVIAILHNIIEKDIITIFGPGTYKAFRTEKSTCEVIRA